MIKVLSAVRTGSKMKVAFDDGTYLHIPLNIFNEFGCVQGTSIYENKLTYIKLLCETAAAKETAFRILSIRSHSEYELKVKLQKKEYSSEAIKDTLEFLRKNDYLNDRVFAERYLEINIKKKGIFKIRRELESKKIFPAIISEIFRNSGLAENEAETAEILIHKKLKESRFSLMNDQKKKEALFRFLASRGFSRETSFNTIKKILSSFEISDW